MVYCEDARREMWGERGRMKSSHSIPKSIKRRERQEVRCISVSLKSATLLFSTAAVLWALTCSRHSAAGLKHFFVCVARSANTNEPDWSCGRLKKQNTHVPPPPAHLFLGKQKKTSTKTKSSDDNKLVEKLTSDWTIPGWLWVVSQNNWAVLF